MLLRALPKASLEDPADGSDAMGSIARMAGEWRSG